MEFLWQYLQVLFMAMAPVLELRAAIPYGILVLDLNPWGVFLIGGIGSFIPAPFIIFLLPKFVDLLFKHSRWMHDHFEKHLKKLHKKHSKNIDAWGSLALILFTAIPFPGTGVWTASMIAFLFKLKAKYTLPAILIGTFVAGVIMTFFSESLQS
jgi:uncharacterized membrane protein